MLGTWLEKQDDVVLARLASIAPWRWNRFIPYYFGVESSGCLMCHAFGCRNGSDYMHAPREGYAYSLSASIPATKYEPEKSYLKLGHRLGDRKLGILISKRAESILVRRYINEIIADIPIRSTALVLV